MSCVWRPAAPTGAGLGAGGSAVPAVSVSLWGAEDVDLEKATGEVFMALQKTLNSCQCSIRELTQVPERDECYLEACVIALDLDDYANEFASLMKSLKAVGRQVLGPCPAACKAEYKVLLQSRAIEKAERDRERDLDRKMRLGVVDEKMEE